MIHLRETWIVVGSLFAALIIASTIGYALHRRFRATAKPGVIDNLNARIRAWWVMVIVVSIATLTGQTAVTLLFAFISFAALREFITITPVRPADHGALFAAFFIVLPSQYFLIGADWYGMFAVYIPVYVFLILPATTAIRGDVKDFLARASQMQWGLMVCVFCISHIPALVTLRIPGFEGRSPLLVAFLLLVTELSDIFQYVWGMLFGRHKIAPEVSPSKTVEGFIGGIVSATIVGALFWRITPFNPLQAAAMALATVVMGFLGGLVMSAMKRDRGIKDWGSMIEGHGGMLDRLDSLCFAAPVFFHLTRFFYVP